MTDTSAGSPSQPPSKPDAQPVSVVTRWLRGLSKVALVAAGISVALVAVVAIGIALTLAVGYPNLPDTASLTDYRPKLPIRSYSADGLVLGVFA